MSDMSTAALYREFHAVPQDEPNHVIDGPGCPCEPKCLLAGEVFRVFIHRPEKVKFLVRKHDVAPIWWNAK